MFAKFLRLRRQRNISWRAMCTSVMLESSGYTNGEGNIDVNLSEDATLVVRTRHTGWLPANCARSSSPGGRARAEVMPFDLERTTHIFTKLDNGGLQQVLSDDNDVNQIKLIREHLAEEADRFSQGDFHDPEMIHNAGMAGLHALTMGADRLTIVYSDADSGGQILYTTEDADLASALHAWFDQQVSDHGSHAMMQDP